jgi:hypothetical protein
MMAEFHNADSFAKHRHADAKLLEHNWPYIWFRGEEWLIEFLVTFCFTVKYLPAAVSK